MTEGQSLRLAWRGLAARHLDVASVLADSFPDAAFFHVYHAFECLACSEILARSPEETLSEGHRVRRPEERFTAAEVKELCNWVRELEVELR